MYKIFMKKAHYVFPFLVNSLEVLEKAKKNPRFSILFRSLGLEPTQDWEGRT